MTNYSAQGRVNKSQYDCTHWVQNILEVALEFSSVYEIKEGVERSHIPDVMSIEVDRFGRAVRNKPNHPRALPGEEVSLRLYILSLYETTKNELTEAFLNINW